MRISIRDPPDLTPKSITVMDAPTAHWLSALLPGSRVEALGQIPLNIPAGKPGRPRRHASNADRRRASREKQRNKRLLDCLCGGPEGDAQSHGTAYASIYDTEPLLHLNAGTTEHFVDLLRECHHRKIRFKHENFLMSPAHFEPDAPASGTRRGLGNIQHVNGIWPDNDGGDLTPDAFARLFPALRMLIWNTYSSTSDHLRWCCFIPATNLMTVEDYACITRQISRTETRNSLVADDNAGVNEVINRWRNAQLGDGHRAFYRLASDLRQCGLSQGKARHHLLAEVRQARSPRDREVDARTMLRKMWKAA